MPVQQVIEKGVNANIHLPSSNTAAVVTFTAVAGRQHVVAGIAYSYSGTPTNGNLKVEDGATTVLSVDITAAGPGYLPVRLKGSINTALTITLAAGGSGVSGKANAIGHYAE